MSKLPRMCNLVNGAGSHGRRIAFSSGQEIKPIRMVKVAYFELVLQCLEVAKSRPEKFVIDMDSLDLFALIQVRICGLRDTFWRTVGTISRTIYSKKLHLC